MGSYFQHGQLRMSLNRIVFSFSINLRKKRFKIKSTNCFCSEIVSVHHAIEFYIDLVTINSSRMELVATNSSHEAHEKLYLKNYGSADRLLTA